MVDPNTPVLVHQDEHGYDLGPRWIVERRPMGSTGNWVVRFVKWGRVGKLLDQTACWTGANWAPGRWYPKHPGVPHTLIAIVERHMRQLGPATQEVGHG